MLILTGLLLLGSSKASTPKNEIASNVNQTDTATITITMRTPPLPDEKVR